MLRLTSVELNALIFINMFMQEATRIRRNLLHTINNNGYKNNLLC